MKKDDLIEFIPHIMMVISAMFIAIGAFIGGGLPAGLIVTGIATAILAFFAHDIIR